jgi:KDO2-lipid IV(A) lauroyltransferase
MAKPRFKHVVEYGLLRVLMVFFQWLPYRLALGMAWLLAVFIHFGLRFRAREARRRIREAIGEDLPASRVRRIAWISFRNICFNAVEIVRLPRTPPDWFDRHVHMASAGEIREQLRGAGCVVLATLHMGNWDVLGIKAHRLGYPVFFIARRQKNPLTDACLNRMRGVTGVKTLLNDEHIVREVLRQLRAGQWLAILPDVRSRQPAMAVPFLGKDANLAEGAALFARQVNAPIIPMVSVRQGWTRLVCARHPAIFPDPAADKKEDIRRMMRELMDVFTRCIREHPEQYFWYNKRWVLEPPADGEKAMS